MEVKILTTTEVAKLLGIHYNTLINWDKTGKLVALPRFAGSPRHYLLAQLKEQFPHLIPEDYESS